MSEMKPKIGIVEFPEVRDSELNAIALRRQRIGLSGSIDDSDALPAEKECSTPEEKANARASKMELIGLALSGGGVRSAAFCLGALQGLHQRGVLPLIDYLSTVSGGGYAGGYLSSLSLNTDLQGSSSPRVEPKVDSQKATVGNPKLQHKLDEALGTANASQPHAVRRLVSCGDFLLRKTFIGLNRNLVGILLIWTLVGSGLIAATSLAAYLYRSLDAVPCRQFLAVLGISDQLSLDLFPPFVMFLIYLLIWGFTYWRSGSSAQAPLARGWLIATVIVALVALATLMGSGNITVNSVAGLIGASPSGWIQSGIKNLSHFVVPLIVTGLLPWFFPRQLFQSGGQEQSGIKQWIFRVASWALLGGVPFLLVAYFAYEGIGGSTLLVDDRIRLPQIKEWDRVPFAPLWLRLRGEHALELNAPQGSKLKAEGALDAKNLISSAEATTGGEGQLHQIWEWVDHGNVDEPASDRDGLFSDLVQLYGGTSRLELKKDTPLEQMTPGDEWSWRTSRLGVLTRWYHLIEYSLGRALGLDALDEYQFAKILKQHEDINELKERIVFRLNQLLLRPDFYLLFPQKETFNKFSSAAAIETDSVDPTAKKDEWKVIVGHRRREAESLALSIDSSLNKSMNWKKVMNQFLPGSTRALSLIASGGLPLSDQPLNGGHLDTPWLIELRPRWSLLPAIVEREVSTDRRQLLLERTREEQSYYPDSEYSLGNVRTLQQQNSWESKQRREAADSELARAFDPVVRAKLVTMQSDSYYIVKRWAQVKNSPDLKGFINNHSDDAKKGGWNSDDSDLPAKVLWSVLLPQAWHELPWRTPSPTTVRDVDRDLQQIITAQSYNMRRVLTANRNLLEAYFPGTIEPAKAKSYSYIVLQRDQNMRWGWFCWSLGCFVLVGLLLDLNFTSWHGFYADRIGGTWINSAMGIGPRIPLAQLRTTEEGLPYHLINGSLIPFDRNSSDLSPTELFLMSQQFAGSESTGYRRVSELQDENYNLASAVAISGGAVNPLNIRNPIQRMILFLFNIRLGQWIENPGFRGSRWRFVEWLGRKTMVSPFRFLFVYLRPLRNRMNCFVTDGGLTENLGINPLIRRRCKVILAIDAGQDGRFQFHDLAKLQRWTQVTDGTRIKWMQVTPESTLGVRAGKQNLQPLCLTPVMATGCADNSGGDKGSSSSGSQANDPFGRRLNPDAAQHYLIGRIEYPNYAQAKNDAEREKCTGYLVYMKSTICPTDPEQLVNYQKINPFFPHDPTTDLDFRPEQFESYRHLGEHTVISTLNAMSVSPFDPMSNSTNSNFIDSIKQAYRHSYETPAATNLAIETGVPEPSLPAVSVPATSVEQPRGTMTDVSMSGLTDAMPAATKVSASSNDHDLEMHQRIVLEHEDLWARKASVHEFDGHDTEKRKIIEALVQQLQESNSQRVDDAQYLLPAFGTDALSSLRADLKDLVLPTKIRRLRVMADILFKDFDSATAFFLLDWLDQSPSQKIRTEIHRTLCRVPFESYSEDEILKKRILDAMHTR